VIRANTCPYCGAKYTVEAGGCVARCQVGEVLKRLIREAARWEDERDPREGEP